MSNPHVSRLRKHFPAYVYGNIAACLKLRQGVGATILICCAIDTLAMYASASPSFTSNKVRFKQFVSKYFPKNYDPESFYKFVRCGLVHSFNMESQYLILCSKESWAQELHLTKPKGYNRTIINPYPLQRHLKKAHELFVSQLEKDRVLRIMFSKIYHSRPLVKQSVKVRRIEKRLLAHKVVATRSADVKSSASGA